MSEELKPCPFCGNTDIEMGPYIGDACPCMCHKDYCTSSSTEFIPVWNARPAEDLLHARIDKAVELLKDLRIPHYENGDDEYYSCPKAELYRGRYRKKPMDQRPCECGADEQNAVIAATLAALRGEYEPNGAANPKGDAAYWRARAEAAEAENARLREALERFAKIDLNDPIAGSIGWDILNARAALQPPTEETE